MSRPDDLRWLAPVLALLLVLAPGFGVQTLLAQDADPADESSEEGASTGSEGLDVEAILEEDQEGFANRGYGYDPGDRRDPFISLRRVRSDTIPDRGPRPEGVPGLLIGEIDLTGIFVLPEGPVAQVQTADRDRSYLIRAGDKLYDGDVVSVSLDEVVFRQILDDPTALTPFRDVVKRLNP